MEEKINSAVKKALESAPERKFVESIEMAFTIKDVDLKNPANRIEENVRLQFLLDGLLRTATSYCCDRR